MNSLICHGGGPRLSISRSSAWAAVVATTATALWSLAGRPVWAEGASGEGDSRAATEIASEPSPTSGTVGVDGGSPSSAADAGGAIDGGTATTTQLQTPPDAGDSDAWESDEVRAKVVEVPPAGTGSTTAAQPEVAVAASRTPSTPAPTRHYGLGADIGFSGPLPDVGLLLALRPIRWIQVQAGGGYNGIGFGVHGGATLVSPLVVPLSLTCEGGHYFEGDANKVVRWFSSDVQEIASLRRFSYDYLNLLGGIEFGREHFSFYLRGGVTWMRTTIKDFAQSVHDVAQVDLQASDPKVTYRGPTLKLGTQYFF